MTDDHWTFDDFDLRYENGEIILPEVYVAIEISLEAGPGFDPDQTVETRISNFEAQLWLQHAAAKVLNIGGHTTCRLPTIQTVDVPAALPEAGVHDPETCVEGDDSGCMLHETFGPRLGFNGSLKNQGIHGYDAFAVWEDPPEPDDEETYPPYDYSPSEAFIGLWRLEVDDLATLGLVAEAIDYIDAHADGYRSLGGASQIRTTVERAKLLNPLYSPLERLDFVDEDTRLTYPRNQKDLTWENDLRPAAVEALQDRIAGEDGLDAPINPDDDDEDDETPVQHTEPPQKGGYAMSYWG